MMVPEIKSKWIEALLSGKYAQGRERLRRGVGGAQDKFCCLGVLCDIVQPGGWKEDVWGTPGFCHENGSQWPPPAIYSAAGLTRDEAGDLALMNDRGESFAEIAQYIQENL